MVPSSGTRGAGAIAVGLVDMGRRGDRSVIQQRTTPPHVHRPIPHRRARLPLLSPCTLAGFSRLFLDPFSRLLTHRPDTPFVGSAA